MKTKVNNIGILSYIKLENSETFKNIKFPENKTTKSYNLFNENHIIDNVFIVFLFTRRFSLPRK